MFECEGLESSRASFPIIMGTPSKARLAERLSPTISGYLSQHKPCTRGGKLRLAPCSTPLNVPAESAAAKPFASDGNAELIVVHNSSSRSPTFTRRTPRGTSTSNVQDDDHKPRRTLRPRRALAAVPTALTAVPAATVALSAVRPSEAEKVSADPSACHLDFTVTPRSREFSGLPPPPTRRPSIPRLSHMGRPLSTPEQNNMPADDAVTAVLIPQQKSALSLPAGSSVEEGGNMSAMRVLNFTPRESGRSRGYSNALGLTEDAVAALPEDPMVRPHSRRLPLAT